MVAWIMRLHDRYGDLYIPWISGIKQYELSLRSPPPTRKTLFSFTHSFLSLPTRASSPIWLLNAPQIL